MNFKDLGLEVIDTELQAIERLKSQINGDYSKACELLLSCNGRIVVTGMGKSGHIAKKIAATLASTGSPAFFIHPGEACHGDLGMLTPKDIVIAISYSGETKEVITLLPVIKRSNITLIAITGNVQSTLAKKSTVHLDASIEKEACPHNLAPTASTTAALVLGDALSITLLKARGFTAEDFALSHPGGSLGKRLLLHIDDIMHTGVQIPTVTPDTTVKDALLEINSKRLGMTAVVSSDDTLLGVFTDGDLRRTLENDTDIKSTAIKDVMTQHPITIKAGMLAAELLQLMEKNSINGIFVTNTNNKVTGALNMQDLLHAGVI